jgi:hypothetical protein
LQAYQRCHSLSFLEFLEALCRVADMMSPPPVEELVEVREGGHRAMCSD